VNIVEKWRRAVWGIIEKNIAPTGAVTRAAPGRFVKEREPVR
jgi:hypothetical protein